jgi:hypoxanthine phosphoribosyltransferase
LQVIYSAEEIAERVGELAREINADLGGGPLLVLGVLKGSIIFLSDLIRRLEMPLRFELVAFYSYRGGDEPGELRFYGELPHARPGERILVVEDIVDTGRTLTELRRFLDAHYGRPVSVCVFVNKPERRRRKVKVDYTGFTYAGDGFVVGYGLDYAERYRNLPHIALLEPEDR